MTSIDTPSPRRCLAATARGRPCRAWALKGGDYCVVHNSRKNSPLAGRNPDPPRPEPPTIDDLIRDTCARFSILAAMLDQEPVGTDLYFKTLKVYSRYIPHLSSLLRVKRAIGHPPADNILDIIAQAIDQLIEEQSWTAFESLNSGRRY